MVRLLLGVNHQPVPAVQREHVKVLHLIFVGFLQSFVTHLPIQNLPHVLHHEIALVDITDRLQAPPSSARVERCSVGVLEPSHLLIVAEWPDGTGLGVALDVDGAIDAD